jgi:Flp pilus assembly pilin Flp
MAFSPPGLRKSYSRGSVAEPKTVPDETVQDPSISQRLATDDRGQDLIEYAVIATFISLLAIVAATALNAAVGSLYTATSNGVSRGANFSSQSSATTASTDCPKDQPENPACK